MPRANSALSGTREAGAQSMVQGITGVAAALPNEADGVRLYTSTTEGHVHAIALAADDDGTADGSGGSMRVVAIAGAPAS